jgi:signal transduction histidine kinase
MYEAETPPCNPNSANGKGLCGLRQVGLTVTACLFGVVIFAFDLVLPLGALSGIPYVILVLLGWFAEGWTFILATSTATTLLTVAGHLLSPPGGDISSDLANRTAALAAIWCVAALLLRIRFLDRVKAHRHEKLTAEVKASRAEFEKMRSLVTRTERLATVGQLAGTTAHELRNPLGVIVTSVSVIEIKARKAVLDIKTSLDRIQRAIKRCERIIDEHLDAARAKGHRPKAVALDDWLRKLVTEMPDTKTATLLTELEAPNAVVDIDSDTLQRALINLVDNAREALTDQNADGIVTIGSRHLEGRAEIFVGDNGPGIPAHLLQHVTETLFSTKPYGTGLGLPAVQRIVEDHGGSMTIESPAGRGTRVILRLPLSGQG